MNITYKTSHILAGIALVTLPAAVVAANFASVREIREANSLLHTNRVGTVVFEGNERKMSLSEMKHGITDGIMGTVVSVGEPVVSETTKLVVQKAIMSVEDVFEGGIQPREKIIVEVPGGKIGNTTYSFPHGVQLEEGESVLLFLRKNIDDSYTIYAGNQGKMQYDKVSDMVTSKHHGSHNVKEFKVTYRTIIPKNNEDDKKDIHHVDFSGVKYSE